MAVQTYGDVLKKHAPTAGGYGSILQKYGPGSGPRVPGNIDLNHRPVVHNPDGTVSTELSFSIGTDQGEVLLPSVIDGKVMSQEDAIAHFKATGEHLGIFDTPESATAYAEKIHNRELPKPNHSRKVQRGALDVARDVGGFLEGSLEQLVAGAEKGTGRILDFAGRAGETALNVLAPGELTRAGKARRVEAAGQPGRNLQAQAETHPAPQGYAERFSRTAGGIAPIVAGSAVNPALGAAAIGGMAGSGVEDAYARTLQETGDEATATQAALIQIPLEALYLAPLTRALGGMEGGTFLRRAMDGALSGLIGPASARIVGTAASEQLTKGEKADLGAALKRGLGDAADEAAVNMPIFALLHGLAGKPAPKATLAEQTKATLGQRTTLDQGPSMKVDNRHPNLPDETGILPEMSGKEAADALGRQWHESIVEAAKGYMENPSPAKRIELAKVAEARPKPPEEPLKPGAGAGTEALQVTPPSPAVPAPTSKAPEPATQSSPTGERAPERPRKKAPKEEDGQRGALDLFGPRKAVAKTKSGEEGFDVPEETRADRLYSGAVHDMERIVRLEKAAPNKVSGDASIEQSLSALPGKRFGEVERAKKRIVEPMHRELQAAKIPAHESTPEKVSASDFLYALSAPRANETLAADGAGDAGSGMATPDAQALVKKALASPNRETYLSIQGRNREIIKTRLDAWESGGLLNPEGRKAIEERWGPDYVPLKTLEDPEALFKGGSGLAVSGKEFKKREGRSTKADSPIAFSLASMESAITRKERNLVGQKIAEMVEKNPHSIWGVTTDRNKIPKDHEALSFKRNGEQAWIHTGDKGLVEAFKRIEDPDPSSLKALDPILGWMHKTIIKWDPTFPLRNMPRDMGVASIRHAIHGDMGAAVATVKNAIPAAKGAWDAIRTEGAGGKWGERYRELRDHGGLVGWNENLDVAKRIKDFEKAVTHHGKAHAFGQWLEDLNQSTEIGTRLATFDALLKASKPMPQAIMETRRITADFARRGRWGPTYRRLYLFSGANVQGIAEASRSISRNPQRAATVTGALVGAGFLNYALSRAYGDEHELEKLSESDKARFFGPMVGKRRYGFAAPYGFNVFSYMGWKIGEVAFGEATPGESMASILSEGMDSFSPLPAGANFWQTITPTVLRPGMEISQNRDYANHAIAPDKDPYARVQTPNALNYFPNVNPVARLAALGLHVATGGTKTKPGMIELSPEWIEHMAKAATGSAGTQAGRMGEVALKVITGKGSEVRLGDIPIVRPFVHETSIGAEGVIYRKNLTAIELAKKQAEAGEEVDHKELLGWASHAAKVQGFISKIRKAMDASEEARRDEFQKQIDAIQEDFNRAVKASRKD